MGLFPVLQTSGSALYVNRIWMDAIADNLANINTVNPFDEPAFQARYVVAEAIRTDGRDPVGVGGGTRVAGVEFGDEQGRLRYQPDHPYANEQGIVRYPDIDLSDQMTQLILAQRSYQMNLTVIDRARDAYLQALNIQPR
jgi:flagellar basal-body rod protein FlgC